METRLRFSTKHPKVKSPLEGPMTSMRLSEPFKKSSDTTIRSAFHEARLASRKLRETTVKSRLKKLALLKKVIAKSQKDIVDRITKETGKSMGDAIGSEIIGTIETLNFLIKQAPSALKDEKITTPLLLMGKPSAIYYEPRGVVLMITPWNYPFYQAIVPALFSYVAGNATIIKPSEYTPLTGLIENLLSLAEFKREDIQILYGDGETAAKAIQEKPNYISFTGSLETGKKVLRAANEFLIPTEIELGGKDPMIVFKDIDFDRTIAGAVWGSFTTAGQSCTSIERILVESTIYPEFLDRFLEYINTLQYNQEDQLNLDMGEITNWDQIQKIHRLVKDAESKGANIVLGGDWDGLGLTYPPTVITDVTSEMDICHEEIFGPVVVLETFHQEKEAIRKANDSQFGLSASIWTKNKAQANRVARQLETGNISINNVMLTEGNSALPFGGTKLSGIGKIKGVQGLRNLCNAKSVMIDKQSKKIEANWYPYSPIKFQLFQNLVTGLTRGLLHFAAAGLKLEQIAQKKRADLIAAAEQEKAATTSTPQSEPSVGL